MLRAMALTAAALGASGCGPDLCADAHGGLDRAESGDVLEVRAGDGLTCARHADGRVSCIGAWIEGPIDVPGIRNAASLTIYGAYEHTNFVVLDSGEVYSWQVDGTPVAFGVDGAQRFASYFAPRYQTPIFCVMASGGSDHPRGWVTCQDAEGGVWRDGPVLLDFSSNGWDYCQVDETGVVDCGGSSVYGGEAVSGVAQVAVGSPTCVRLTTGEVACWDYEISGEPALVEGIHDAVDIASGGGHACAARSNGRVSCWGSNEYGELGTGHRDDWDDPIQPASDVVDLDDAVQVTAGDRHTCALRSTGAVVCWGDVFPTEDRDECLSPARPTVVRFP